MKNKTPKQNLFALCVSSTFILSHTFRPIRTRNARSALRARRGLKLERRARTHGALPWTRRTEGTERKGLDTRNSKILGEFCHHKKTVNKKRVETKEGIQKIILGTRKKIYKLPPAKIKKERRDHCADARRRDGYDANTLTPENATVLTRCAAAKLHVTP